MLKNQYISLILLLIVLVTLVNLYYKPYLTDPGQPLQWIKSFVHPVTKSICALQGFKCQSDDDCDCEELCRNGKEFVPFRILEGDRIYVMNQKLSPGTYCLPKGVGKCNRKTSYHIFSLAGWSCIDINTDVFKRDKRKACKNEEALENELNVLWDYKKNEEAGDDVEDYYELHGGDLRYRCKCDSMSLDNTRMISVFPFVCSVDYCLRNFENPTALMGWNGTECDCGPYFHLIPSDQTSPCMAVITKIENEEFVGKVSCMTNNSFVKEPLLCPTDDSVLFFKEYFHKGNKPQELIDKMIVNQKI